MSTTTQQEAPVPPTPADPDCPCVGCRRLTDSAAKRTVRMATVDNTEVW